VPIQRLAPRSTLDAAWARARQRAGPDDRVEACTLWSAAWDGDALIELRATLGPNRLATVEPVAGLGWRRLVQRLLAPWWRRRLGHDFDRDLPRELRAAGFTIDEIDRFTADPLGLRTYAYLELSSHPR
jgi:hypothetical protein